MKVTGYTVIRPLVTDPCVGKKQTVDTAAIMEETRKRMGLSGFGSEA
jgi:hypothetical protein